MSELSPVLTDATTLRERVRGKVVRELERVFPVDLKGRTLEVKDIRVHAREYSPEEQKSALLTGDSLSEPVKGTLVLKDAEGKVVNEARNFTLTHLPWFSERHTIVMDGNEYQIANMLRRRPGAYTQRSGNGELHTTFNLSKGANFNVTIDPAKSAFYLVYDSTNIPLYPVLRALGVSHEAIAKELGGEIADANKALFGGKEEVAIAKLYAKLAHETVFNAKASHTEKLAEVVKRFANTAMDAHVTRITLGAAHDRVTPQTLLAAAQKLLRVHKGHDPEDDADSLAFKTFHSVDDFLAERVKLTAREWAPKARMALNGKQEIRGALKPAPFSQPLRQFVTSSALAAVPTGINPIELIDHSVKVTALGEGGIPSERAIPFSTRLTHPTHFGILDPIRTPECYDRETEVLTYAGWKKWPDVTSEDRLACRVDGRLEFHKPEKLIAAPYRGVLHGVKNSKIEYLVTPNHRVLCAPLDAVYPRERAGAWRIARADEVHGKPRVFDTGHEAYTGGALREFKLPAVSGPHNVQNVGPIDMELWASFMGWYISEGSVGRHEGRLTHTLISQDQMVNAWKCEIITVLLNRLPFTWRYDEVSRAFAISGKQLATYLEPFGFCDDKFIPDYLFETSAAARENLLEALLLGDGRVGSRRKTGKHYDQQVYCTTSARLARDVERLALSLGRPVRVSRYEDRREERYLDVFEVRILRHRLRQAFPKKGHYYTRLYDDMVYCATVPGGLMYIRRGGGTGLWSGNSGHAGVDIRATIAAHRDEEGNLYTPLRNVRTNKIEFLSATDMMGKVIAFPHQRMQGQVDALHQGQVKKVNAKDVDYQQLHVSHTYSPATSLIPLLHSIQGNRAIMGSKMQTQGLPLIHREAPLVQVKHPDGGSYEDFYGRMVVPLAPVSGVVRKIENGFIYIEPKRAKRAEVEEKLADRPVVRSKKCGGFTFEIEIEKGDKPFGHPFPCDYGYLPGFEGPDGDSLDFWVGDDPDGVLVSVDTDEQDEKGVWRPADVKFIVGVPLERVDAVLRQIERKPKTRCVNRTEYASWDDLKEEIEDYRRGTKTASIHAVKEAASRELVKVPYSDNFPFPSKTRLHHDLKVKPGDTVEMGQMLGDSNFTRAGTLASGLNARVAYMPYYGLNSNDAVVISEGFAKRMTSEHMYREVFPLNATIELSAKRHKVYFGAKYQPSQYAHLDENGVVKKGARVSPHDLLVAGLTKSQVTGTDLMLGKISKTLAKPYSEVALAWEHGTPGEVVDVVRTPTQIAILVKTHEQMQVGDKLSGRYGNKGVVAKIVPDKEMIKDASGKPVELIMTSAGVVSRINPAQLHESLAGKVAEKLKKPILYDNASTENAIDWVERLAKEHNVNGYEHVYDPLSGRKITGPDGQGVFVGRSFVFKLFKSTDTNFAGHGVGPYDVNEQPLKQGGEEGAKGLGKMEVDALLAHNARGMLSDAANIRGQKNEAFWRAIQLGQQLPAHRPSFAFNKFQAMLEGAGVKVRKDGSKFRLLPATDADILARSSGAIENKKTVVAKNLKPEKGGLFDPYLTGGTQGTLYAHIDLHEPVPNPVFEEPIRRLLGMTEKRFVETLKDRGGDHIKKELARIDIDAKLKELEGKLPTLKASELNDAVKQIKYLRALKAEGLRPENAYVLSKVPVVPPVFRPITPQKNDPSQLMVADANKLYGHLIGVNDAVKEAVLDSDVPKHRAALYNAVGAVFGTHTVEDPKLQKEEVKGFLTQVSGQGSPKGGFFQRKLMKRQQDVSGRGTAVPDGNLHMDAVSLPEDMLWQMFDKLLVARLIRKGYSALHARELVDKRAPAAKQCLLEETKERPVLLNRAPTLHRFGIVAAYAQPTQGKTIRVSPFVEKGFNLDYDGDATFCCVFSRLRESTLRSLTADEHMPDYMWRVQEVPMSARFKEVVGYRDGDKIVCCNLADFPRGEKLYTKGHRTFYKVPPGVDVIAYDENTGRLAFKPATMWSIHEGIEVESATLSSGRQILADDDPRAVYGVRGDTLEYARATPSQALGMFVPVGHDFQELALSEPITSVQVPTAALRTDRMRRVRGVIPLNLAAGRVFGTLAGDGWVVDADKLCSQIALASLDEAVAAQFERDIQPWFTVPVSLTRSDRIGGDFGADVRSVKYVLSCMALGRFVRELIGAKAKNKHLPPFFLVAPREFRLGLLAGLLDTDGSIAVSNGKKTPQWMVNFTSVSLRLCQEVTWLAKSLGVMASVSATRTPQGGDCWQVTFSTPELHKLGEMPCAHTEKAQRFTKFFAGPAPRSDLGGHTRNDTIPFPAAIYGHIRPLYPLEVKKLTAKKAPAVGADAERIKANASMAQLLWRARREGYISRHSATRCLQEHPELRANPDELLQRWIQIVDNTSVRWDRVVSFEKTGIKEDGYDLTVPGHETFMNVEGVILSNTLQVHVPLTRGGVEDAKRMTMSNLLLSDQTPNKLMAFPQHEAIIGITHALKFAPNKTRPARKFKTEAEAIAAWRRGEVKVDDPVEIG